MPSPQPPPPDPQAAQAGLAILVAQAIQALWPSLDLANLRTALPAFKAAVAVEVQRHAQASATLATRQYRQQRVRAGVSGAFTPQPADPPPVEQIAQSVDWAVQPLWNSAVLGEPDTEAEQSAGTAVAEAKARLAASSERLVLDTGRSTVIDNAQRDHQAKGWARVPEPNACSWCLMLATRGAVYRTNRRPTSSRTTTVGVTSSRCSPPTSHRPAVRHAEALWASSTRGKSGNAARIAFRQAVEGRTAPTK
jgi:hypothetical protein